MRKEKTLTSTRGFTLIEILISLVIGSLLLTSLFKLWNTNQKETNRIGAKSDFRDRVTLATTQLNRSIIMAGFGISKMDVIVKSASSLTDTLTLYSNATEFRTTLRDTASESVTLITIFKDSGFVVGGYIGITDSLHSEFNRITAISGDSASGFDISLQRPLGHKYLSGIPDIYPVALEKFYIDGTDHTLIRIIDERRMALAKDMTEFRVSLLDASGNPASSYKSIRVVTFNLAGNFNASTGTPSLMRFSSTVIPRNIL
jgi:prepilin-type N-terminal cleavage/methylation domain-containing protein